MYLSVQLCLRMQQVSEKLNEWAIFNEKYKELCEWLTQMESKVSQNGDISIEEMIEKLRKVTIKYDISFVLYIYIYRVSLRMISPCLSVPQDYQEEVAGVQENKHELQQLGERLARASHESKASDIEHKLSKVNERWQHLLDLIGARYCNLHRDVVNTISTISHNIDSKFILK